MVGRLLLLYALALLCLCLCHEVHGVNLKALEPALSHVWYQDVLYAPKITCFEHCSTQKCRFDCGWYARNGTFIGFTPRYMDQYTSNVMAYRNSINKQQLATPEDVKKQIEKWSFSLPTEKFIQSSNSAQLTDAEDVKKKIENMTFSRPFQMGGSKWIPSFGKLNKYKSDLQFTDPYHVKNQIERWSFPSPFQKTGTKLMASSNPEKLKKQIEKQAFMQPLQNNRPNRKLSGAQNAMNKQQKLIEKLEGLTFSLDEGAQANQKQSVKHSFGNNGILSQPFPPKSEKKPHFSPAEMTAMSKWKKVKHSKKQHSSKSESSEVSSSELESFPGMYFSPFQFHNKKYSSKKNSNVNNHFIQENSIATNDIPSREQLAYNIPRQSRLPYWSPIQSELKPHKISSQKHQNPFNDDYIIDSSSFPTEKQPFVNLPHRPSQLPYWSINNNQSKSEFKYYKVPREKHLNNNHNKDQNDIAISTYPAPKVPQHTKPIKLNTDLPYWSPKTEFKNQRISKQKDRRLPPIQTPSQIQPDNLNVPSMHKPAPGTQFSKKKKDKLSSAKNQQHKTRSKPPTVLMPNLIKGPQKPPKFSKPKPMKPKKPANDKEKVHPIKIETPQLGSLIKPEITLNANIYGENDSRNKSNSFTNKWTPNRQKSPPRLTKPKKWIATLDKSPPNLAKKPRKWTPTREKISPNLVGDFKKRAPVRETPTSNFESLWANSRPSTVRNPKNMIPKRDKPPQRLVGYPKNWIPKMKKFPPILEDYPISRAPKGGNFPSRLPGNTNNWTSTRNKPPQLIAGSTKYKTPKIKKTPPRSSGKTNWTPTTGKSSLTGQINKWAPKEEKSPPRLTGKQNNWNPAQKKSPPPLAGDFENWIPTPTKSPPHSVGGSKNWTPTLVKSTPHLDNKPANRTLKREKSSPSLVSNLKNWTQSKEKSPPRLTGQSNNWAPTLEKSPPRLAGSSKIGTPPRDKSPPKLTGKLDNWTPTGAKYPPRSTSSSKNRPPKWGNSPPRITNNPKKWTPHRDRFPPSSASSTKKFTTTRAKPPQHFAGYSKNRTPKGGKPPQQLLGARPTDRTKEMKRLFGESSDGTQKREMSLPQFSAYSTDFIPHRGTFQPRFSSQPTEWTGKGKPFLSAYPSHLNIKSVNSKSHQKLSSNVNSEVSQFLTSNGGYQNYHGNLLHYNKNTEGLGNSMNELEKAPASFKKGKRIVNPFEVLNLGLTGEAMDVNGWLTGLSTNNALDRDEPLKQASKKYRLLDIWLPEKVMESVVKDELKQYSSTGKEQRNHHLFDILVRNKILKHLLRNADVLGKN